MPKPTNLDAWLGDRETSFEPVVSIRSPSCPSLHAARKEKCGWQNASSRSREIHLRLSVVRDLTKRDVRSTSIFISPRIWPPSTRRPPSWYTNSNSDSGPDAEGHHCNHCIIALVPFLFVTTRWGRRRTRRSVKQPQSEATPLRLVYVHILRGSNPKGVNTEPQADTQFLGATKFHGRKEEKWRTRKRKRKSKKHGTKQ